MTSIDKFNLICKCGCEFREYLYSSVNTEFSPEVFRLIYDDKFNVAECPKCHKRCHIDIWILFSNVEKRFMAAVREGDFGRFKEYLASEGYFEGMKKSKKSKSGAKKTLYDNTIRFKGCNHDGCMERDLSKMFECIYCRSHYCDKHQTPKPRIIPKLVPKNEEDALLWEWWKKEGGHIYNKFTGWWKDRQKQS